MAITVTCPNGHLLRVRDEFAGKSGLCPHCRARIQVPQSERVSEDDVLAMLDTPKPSAPLSKPSEEFVHQESRHDNLPGESGVSLQASSLLRRKKVCSGCGNITSYTFTNCPRCGTPLPEYTASPSGEASQPSAKSGQYLTLQRQGDVLVVRLGQQPKLDPATVEKIGRELRDVADRVDFRNLLLNFTDLMVLSGSLLENVLAVKRKIESKGGKLKLCQISPEIRELLIETRLGNAFDIWDNERDALKAFAASASVTKKTP
jgi:anti-sigma B factor antagonist